VLPKAMENRAARPARPTMLPPKRSSALDMGTDPGRGFVLYGPRWTDWG
jgi:hypothetical protein